MFAEKHAEGNRMAAAIADPQADSRNTRGYFMVLFLIMVNDECVMKHACQIP